MKTVTQNTQGAKDAPKVEIEVKTPVSADVVIKPEPKPAPKKKATTTDAPKAERESETESAKPDLSKVSPLVVPKELLESKLKKLDEKLSKEKRETTKTPYHIAYGFFVAKTKAGNVVRLEYHESLRPAKWIARDSKGKILGEPAKTMHLLHDRAILEF
jgi:hypothetical protein